MKITILAHGSRGDVQPYLALALGLACRGHQVRMAAPEMFRAWIESCGLAFAPLAGDPRRLMQNAGKAGLQNFLPLPIRAGYSTLSYALPVMKPLMQDIRSASQDTDLLIHTLLTTGPGIAAASERGIPHISALVFPVLCPTEAFANPLFPQWKSHPRYNFISHREFNRVFWRVSRMGITWLRRQGLNIPDIGQWAPDASPPMSIIYGISPSAIPRPTDWPAHAHLTGYWLLRDFTWQPPVELQRFLEAGPPPIFISFGSLIPRDADRLVRLAIDALGQTGARGVLLGGWSGLPDIHLPDTVFSLPEAPYDRLFPHMAAAIHHAGAGTTASALHAGIPSITVPFTFDQPFWGERLADLGVGMPPISRRRLTTSRLAHHIHAVFANPQMGERAAAMGRQIQMEDGVNTAAEIIEKTAA
jgi:sterol 3beta-glucosyltransferase